MATKKVPNPPTQEEEDDPETTFIVYHSGNSTDADGNVTKIFSRVTMDAYKAAGLV
jgi:hypothetical protein